MQSIVNSGRRAITEVTRAPEWKEQEYEDDAPDEGLHLPARHRSSIPAFAAALPAKDRECA